MSSVTKGAEEARNQLPRLLEAAENGQSTVITKHGRPVAALVPIAQFGGGEAQSSLLQLKGSGRAYWGDDSAALDALRDEWNR